MKIELTNIYGADSAFTHGVWKINGTPFTIHAKRAGGGAKSWTTKRTVEWEVREGDRSRVVWNDTRIRAHVNRPSPRTIATAFMSAKASSPMKTTHAEITHVNVAALSQSEKRRIFFSLARELTMRSFMPDGQAVIFQRYDPYNGFRFARVSDGKPIVASLGEVTTWHSGTTMLTVKEMEVVG